MKSLPLLILIVSLLSFPNSLEAALDFSVFQVIGFEGKGELEFNQPDDLIPTPDGDYAIADTNNNRIQILDPSGNFKRIIPTPKPKVDALVAAPTDTRPSNVVKLQNFGFKRPIGLAFDSNRRLYASLMTSDQIAVIDYDSGNVIKIIGSSGKRQGQFWKPMDIAIDGQDRLAVAEFGNKRVQILDLDGKFLKEIIYQEETIKGGFKAIEPRGVFWTQGGDLIVTYPYYHQVVCWNIKEGSIRWRYGGNQKGKDKGMLNNPSYVAQGQERHLLISDTNNGRIVEITGDGKFYEHHSQKGSAPGRLNTPRGLFLNEDEALIISDSGNGRAHFFTAGQATLLLKEAKKMELVDDWVGVMNNAEKVFYLQPNNEQAINMLINAYYYFGDKAFKEGDYPKAEDYYRRVLRYRPDDGNIPHKLDAIFWENNRPVIVTVVVAVLGIIAFFIFIWVAKLFIKRFRAKA